MTKSAGIIIIGDEILKGHTQDTNSYHLCQALHRVGVRVKQISVIGDDLDLIASEVKKFSSTYNYVLTSGGIGPTHDDLTFIGIAKAFNERLYPHPTLVELCKKYFGHKSMDSPEMKLAHLPTSACLHFGVDTVKGETFKFPLVSVRNVYIFPGIPVLLRRLIDNLSHLFSTNESFHSHSILIDAIETDIADVLTQCSEKFKDAGLSVGSYPDWFNNYYKVKVIIESANKDATDAAYIFLKQNLKGSVLVNYIANPVASKGEDVFKGAISSNYPHLNQKILQSIHILEDAFKKYPGNSICLGFNGGKDCTVLLHLYYAVLCKKFPDSKHIQVVYIKDKHPFEELESFIDDSSKRYNLKIIALEGEMKEALRVLRKQHPHIKAVVMGTRRTDPYSNNLDAFAETDGDWPRFMRVNPILNWSYHDIWLFLRTLFLPYCVLYDRGYTSLGSREKTQRNEKLIKTDSKGNIRFAPAHTLQDGDLERNGRL